MGARPAFLSPLKSFGRITRRATSAKKSDPRRGRPSTLQFQLKPCALKLLWFKCRPGGVSVVPQPMQRWDLFRVQPCPWKLRPSRMNAEIVEVIVSFLAPGEDVWPADPRTIDVEEDDVDLYKQPEDFFCDGREEARPMSEMRQWLEEVWVPSARSLQAAVHDAVLGLPQGDALARI